MGLKYKVALLAVLTGGAFVCAGQAWAGFQFTAPVRQVPEQTENLPPIQGGLLPDLPDFPVNGAPAATVTPMPAYPQAPVSGPTPLSVPQPQPALQQAAPATPRAPTGIASLATRANAVPAPAGRNYTMAVGFGRDLPLVTALQQIIPSGYTYVMEETVPMSSSVSWEGGRPWNVVLADTLAPLGLRADIAGDKVVIRDAASPSGTAARANAPAPRPIQGRPLTPLAPLARQTAQPVSMNITPTAGQPVFAAPPPQPVSRTVPKVTRGTWTADKDTSLRNVLEIWTAQAGAELFWSSDYDFPLAGDVNISGTFEEAVETLLRGFSEATPKPIARLHPNLPHGPAVLVVETRQVLD